MINSDLLEIKKVIEKINFIKLKYLINNEKINIIISENKNNSIDIKILKNIFKNYNIIGKINFNNKELINKKIINKINLFNY